MQSSIIFSILFLITTTHTIDLTNNEGSLTQDTEASDLAGGQHLVECSGWRYGRQMSQASCLNAWQKMPRSSLARRYGNSRVHGEELVELPLRYLSDDGLCAIDLNEKRNLIGTVPDVTSELILANVAKEVLDQCVSARRTGGLRIDF
ncbi:MAG: hypothetical protein Q9173_002396, partial [Seirophora scorigena]